MAVVVDAQDVKMVSFLANAVVEIGTEAERPVVGGVVAEVAVNDFVVVVEVGAVSFVMGVVTVAVVIAAVFEAVYAHEDDAETSSKVVMTLNCERTFE